MINVTCPQCKRSYELGYKPQTVIGQWVRCKACRSQFVVDNNVSLPTATPGWGPMSMGMKVLLILIPACLLLALFAVGAFLLADR